MFVLETHYLKYFENEAGKGVDSKLKGVINLEGVESIDHTDGALEFSIVTTQGVTKLKAANEAEAQGWVEVLTYAVEAETQEQFFKNWPHCLRQ